LRLADWIPVTPSLRPLALLVATQPLAAGVTRTLEIAGLRVIVRDRGEGALKELFQAQPDLVVLEHGLTEANGADLLHGVRLVSDIPAIVIGDDSSEGAVVAALRGGADRYIALPLRQNEFAASIEALLRRAGSAGAARRTYSDGTLEVDFENYRVSARGIDIPLTPLEFRVLSAFLDNAGRTLTTDDLLEAVWGDTSLPRERVKLYIGYLRNKFRDAGVKLGVQTVRGFGYRYRPAGDEADKEIEALLVPLEEFRGPSGQPFFPNEAARNELQLALSAQ
jgi:DNA-binding response OmpR family regulator